MSDVVDVLDHGLHETALADTKQPETCEYCKSFDYVEWVIDD